jgi:hypothetical protein
LSLIKTPEAAARLARTIASDIAMYNKDRIAEGLKNDNVFEAIEADLSEARTLFEGRVSPEVRETHDFLSRALVDVMLKANAHLPTNIW